jgi:hypothetical protein
MKVLCSLLVVALAATASAQDRISLVQQDFEGPYVPWSIFASGNGAQALLGPGQCGSTTQSFGFVVASTCTYSTGSAWSRGIMSPMFHAFSNTIRVEFDYTLAVDATGDLVQVDLFEYDTLGTWTPVRIADLSTLSNDGLPHRASFSVQVPKAGTQWDLTFSFAADGIGDSLAGWRLDNISISEVSAIRSFCFGDQSGAPCPCGNTSYIPVGGCSNSRGMGAVLTATGSVSVAADDLVLSASRMLYSKTAILMEGLGPVMRGGAPFHDGLLCLTSPIQRVGIAVSDGNGIATFAPGLASANGWLAGSTRYLQVWYRDKPFPCGTGSNLTQAIAVELAP